MTKSRQLVLSLGLAAALFASGGVMTARSDWRENSAAGTVTTFKGTDAGSGVQVPNVQGYDGVAIPAVSVTSAATLFTVADTSGFSSISIQVTSAGSGTITYEVSEDGTTWFSVAGTTPLNTGTTAPVTTSTTAVLLQFPLPAKQFRARVSAYTSGTITVQGTLRRDPNTRIGQAASVIGTATVGGVAAHDAAISGNPVRTACRAVTADYTAVQTGDTADFLCNLVGHQIIRPWAIPENTWNYAAAASGIVNTTTAVTMKAAAAAGIRNYVNSLQIATDTLGAATELAIRDGASGTVLWRGKLQTTALPQTTINFDPPLRGTAATLLEAVTLTAVTGGVYVNAQGFIAP